MAKLSDAAAIYLGTQAVDRIYVGSTLAWQPPPKLLDVQTYTRNSNGNASNGDGTYGAPVTITLAVAAGDTITVVSTCVGTASGTRKITDSAGNAYTKLVDSGGGSAYVIWQATAATTVTLTITANMAAYYAQLACAAYRTRGGSTGAPITGTGTTGSVLSLGPLSTSGPAITLVAAYATSGSVIADSGTVTWAIDAINNNISVGHGVSASAVASGSVSMHASGSGIVHACALVIA